MILIVLNIFIVVGIYSLKKELREIRITLEYIRKNNEEVK